MVTSAPKYKTKCLRCGKYLVIKRGWRTCLPCWEKDNGKYKGEDRALYIPAKIKD